MSGARVASLRYDPLGRLWQVSDSTATTRFQYDGDRMIMDFAAASATGATTNLLHAYVHGPGTDEPIAINDATRHYLFTDRQGSIIGSSGDSGASESVNTYDEYGIPGASNTGRFQYTGQVWRPEVGLYYYKARMYSPTIGRFLQTDPIGYEAELNLYSYAYNSPVNHSDPSGMYPPPEEEEMREADGAEVTPFEEAENHRATEAFETLQRMDPLSRDPDRISATGSLRTTRDADYYIGANTARAVSGYYGQDSVEQSPAAGAFSRELIPARFSHEGSSGGRQTYQYINSSGSALNALRGMVGSNFTREQNGSYQARGVYMGAGVRADINVHRGGFAGRTGWVLSANFNASVNARNPVSNVFNVTIEFPRE